MRACCVLGLLYYRAAWYPGGMHWIDAETPASTVRSLREIGITHCHHVPGMQMLQSEKNEATVAGMVYQAIMACLQTPPPPPPPQPLVVTSMREVRDRRQMGVPQLHHRRRHCCCSCGKCR